MVQAVQGQGGRDLKVGRVVEEVRSYLKWCEKKMRCVFVVRFVSHCCSCNQNKYVAIVLSQANVTVESETKKRLFKI